MKQKLERAAKAKHIIKVANITFFNDTRIYAHVCPKCGRILASSVERDMMPEFSYCEHCIEEKPLYIIHRTHQWGNGKDVMWLERTQAPTMSANILNNWTLSRGEFDSPIDVHETAVIMREAQNWVNVNKDTIIVND